MEYKIEVIMTPHIHDNPQKPYFWCIMSCTQSGSWCNHTFGWAATPEEAWQEAKTFYNKYLNERKN
jgi:hypothetical protein